MNRIYFWYCLASIIELTNLIVEIYRNMSDRMESIQKISFIKDDRKTRMKHGIRWQFARSLWFCPTDKQTICQID